MSRPFSFEVSVLLFQDENIWVAHGIEWDIVAQGKTIAGALEAFERTFVGQAVIDMQAGDPPLVDVPPAPERIRRRFEQGWKINKNQPFQLPDTIAPALISKAGARDLRIAAH